MVLFEVNDLALEILVMNMNIPLIMPIYKIYKNSYKRLTNAQNTILSMLAHVLTTTLMKLIPIFKIWKNSSLMCMKISSRSKCLCFGWWIQLLILL